MSREHEPRGASGGGGVTAPVAGHSPSIPGRGDTILGKYEIEQVLGVGGMGVVVAARHLQLGQRVAIKFVKGDFATDPNIAARFLREARAAGALSSEHAVKVFDVGTLQSGAPFMVMEHLSGVDLSAVLDRDGRLGISEALSALLQACEAIAEAHSLGIVHRDLKPSNLFVSGRNDGTRLIKVLDFGISKDLDGPINQGLTASGSLVGSPGYMSPEQVRSPKTVDARTDVWAIGVILYELLTARSPFMGETLGETFARIVSERAPPIRDLRSDVPEGLAAVIARCLERDLTQRFQSVADVAFALQPFAPPEAQTSVARIHHIARVSRSGSSTATFVPPTPATPARPMPSRPSSGLTPRTGLSQPAVATASVWQSGELTPAPQRSRRKLVLAAIGVLALAGAIFVVSALRRPSASPAIAAPPNGTWTVVAAASASVAAREAPEVAAAATTVPEVPSSAPSVNPAHPASMHVARHPLANPHETTGHEPQPSVTATLPPKPSQPPRPTPTTTSNEKDIF